jgi:hypothetical protein
MAQECAFCPSIATLTGEHIWSDWLNGVLPGRRRFSIKNDKREVVRTWTAPELNWKAKVVCEDCNSGWMSRLENDHAKPAMLDLILDKPNIKIDKPRARSIALFAFKTAVIFDHIAKDRAYFFDRSTRHEFARSHTIPTNVDMWLTRFGIKGHGEANTAYHAGSPAPERSIEMYVLSYSVEALVLQVVSHKATGVSQFSPESEFSAIPFWPDLPNVDIFWPPSPSLNSAADFDNFSDRWQKGTATFSTR